MNQGEYVEKHVARLRGWLAIPSLESFRQIVAFLESKLGQKHFSMLFDYVLEHVQDWPAKFRLPAMEIRDKFHDKLMPFFASETFFLGRYELEPDTSDRVFQWMGYSEFSLFLFEERGKLCYYLFLMSDDSYLQIRHFHEEAGTFFCSSEDRSTVIFRPRVVRLLKGSQEQIWKKMPYKVRMEHKEIVEDVNFWARSFYKELLMPPFRSKQLDFRPYYEEFEVVDEESDGLPTTTDKERELLGYHELLLESGA